MNLTTTYLGLELKNPLVPSASTLSENLDNIRRMEDAGAGALVLYSLFEEQILQDSHELDFHLSHGTESVAESLSYFPEPETLYVGPERYLSHLSEAKAAVDIPVIASLNGSTNGGWLRYAKEIESAGADALELNIYYLPTHMSLSGTEVEQNYIDIVKTVTSAVSLPVAVKLSPFFSNLAHVAQQLTHAGAEGLVLFNRFYQPDIDLETLEIRPRLLLSGHQEMRLPLCWIGLLYGRVPVDFAATSGIDNAKDVVKLILAGADITMLCAALFRHGIPHIAKIREELMEWMETNGYDALHEMRGAMSQLNCPNPNAFERAQYLKAVSTFFPTGMPVL